MKITFCNAALLSLWIAAGVPSVADPSPVVPPKQHSLTQYTIVPTAKMIAKSAQEETDYMSSMAEGKANLRAHNFILAEENFREAVSVRPTEEAYLGLGEALVGQGRTMDALQAYQSIFHSNVVRVPGSVNASKDASKADLEYALLLNQNGQWAEAAAHYNDALPQLVDFGLKNPVQLDPHAPQPLALTVGAYIGLGLYDNLGYEPDSNTKAFAEYTTALGLAPNWDAANYYYGMGWSRLDLKSSVRAAHAAQAKAALKKAAASDDAVVKKAASETLEGLK